MPKLSIVINGAPAGEVELKPGINRVGRSPENDVQITDSSVSGRHCEIHVDGVDFFVRDLGSTNGTFVDEQPVYESAVLPGQRFKAGDVELLIDSDQPAPSVSQASTAKTGLRIAKIEAPVASPIAAPAAAASPSVPQHAYYAPKGTRIFEKGFFRMIPEAFAYPLKQSGWAALICGTLVFLFLNFLGNFSIIVAIIAFGYLAAFMQKMLVSSAQGDEDLPDWPEFSEWFADIIHTALLLIGSFAASFGPAVWFFIFADVDPGLKLMGGLALIAFGCFYLPMALIATSMYGSLFALNPLLIIPSMARIAKEYIAVCLFLGVLIAIRLGVDLGLALAIPFPIVPDVISGFLDLYFLIVQMRILGLLYFFKEDELSWSF